MYNGPKLAVFLFPPASLSFPFPLPSSLYVLSEHPLHIKGCYAFLCPPGEPHGAGMGPLLVNSVSSQVCGARHLLGPA